MTWLDRFNLEYAKRNVVRFSMELRAVLEKTKRRGWTPDDEEHVPVVRFLVCGIRNSDERKISTVSVSCPVACVTKLEIQHIVAIVRIAVAGKCRCFGFETSHLRYLAISRG